MSNLTDTDKVITRFAPSPTGYVHLGNIRTALLNMLLARKHGGEFLLRIEDTDAERSDAEYCRALMEDMRWLGLDWQRGPDDPSGKPGAYHQSQRTHIYNDYYAKLQAAGKVYPCFCSSRRLELLRKTQLSGGRPPRYDGMCAHLSAEEIDHKLAQGEQPTLRFRVPAGSDIRFVDLVRGEQRFDSDDIGDFIIRRADGTPAFFFTNAVDDALMGVSHVLRGDDHLTNTPRQLLLLQALEMPAPSYGHIALIVGDDGAPLSKRHGSFGIREMRGQGYLPMAIVNYLARLGHYYADNSFMTRDQLAANFDCQHLGRAPAHFDAAQLQYWQREAITAADDDNLWRWFGQEVRSLVPAARQGVFIQAVRPNITYPADALAWARVFFAEEFVFDDDADEAIEKAAGDFFKVAATVLAEESDFKVALKAIGSRTGAKGKSLYLPLRAALTGKLHGPEMSDLSLLLDTQEMIRRCLKVNDKLSGA